MSGSDFLTVEKPTVAVNEGDYDAFGLSSIEASYRLEGDKLSVLDDGDLSGEPDESIMVSAPLHFAVKSGRFSGAIRIEDKSIIVENNIVVNVI